MPAGPWCPDHMQAFNRMVTGAAAVLTALLCVAAILVMTSSTEEVQQAAYPNYWTWEQSQSLNQLTALDKMIALAISAALGVGGLILLVAELRPPKRRTANLLIHFTDAGTATIDTNSVEALAAQTAMSNAKLTSVKCAVHQSGTNIPSGPDRVQIRCQPTLKMGTNVREIAEDLQQRIKAMVESSTGLEVQAVHVLRARFQKLPKGRLLDEPDRAGL